MSAPPIVSHIDRASFAFWTKEQIEQISVKKITEPKSFEKLGTVNQEGLYSSALGPVKRFENCTTCGLTDIACPGHYGHVELCVPLYHPMLIQVMFQILNKCCLECYHFRLSDEMFDLFLAQLEALNCGYDHLIEELDEIARDICGDDKDKTDSYLHVILRNKLQAKIREEKEKNSSLDDDKRPQVRSIVESYSKLFRSFIMGKLVKPLKNCPHCHEKKMTLTLVQQSVIVIGTNKQVEDEKVKSKKSSKIYKKLYKLDHNLRHLHTDEKRFLTPIGVRYYFRKLWKYERDRLSRIFPFLNLIKDIKRQELDPSGDQEPVVKSLDPKERIKRDSKFQPIDIFFIDTILVPPSKFRPPMSQRGYSYEGPRTAAIGNVMKQSIVVEDLIDQMFKEKDDVESEKLQPKLQSNWKALQNTVNSLFDSEMDKYGKNKFPGLKQLIDKKEGLFRKNMMGKRVNFAARSVISPDPNILVDQIGVPLVFAKKLTYPQPITPWNIQQLKEAVLNGPDKYPGATSIVFDDGKTVSLKKLSVRESIAARLSYNPRYVRYGNKETHMATIVNRHLITGDVLLFNRQPTLHKPSIMAFRARVLPNEKGFRLHYANCKSFNADFDGDEMNAHLPQSELARSEAYNIASVNHQYLVPKDGSPLGGLIQDHVIAVCLLTDRNQFLDKERYNQLVYCALSFLSKTLNLEPPTIMKPVQSWTGKQVITTIIKNCIPEGRLPPSLKIKSKIGPKILNIPAKYENLSDCHVIIRNGELLVGFMDKSNVGATQYGLIHLCYELYGGETSSYLMSAFARLATWYLALYEGFTLGIKDIIVDDEANADRARMIKESLVVGPDSAKEALGVTGDITEEKLTEKLRDAHSDRDPLPMKKLDAAMKKRTDKVASNISSRCLPGGLIVPFPNNNLQMMIQSGAKGGTVNALQISCLLGQIELEGRRVPLSMSGRTLPSFQPYDTSPKAGGFVSGRFLTGIQPQEFFFHCMAGREGLIDTAVKTSRSGYLQRCLIKHLEGLIVQYDQTVRDSCGSIIQFLYGEDGLDILKSQMLKNKAFPLLVENYDIVKPARHETEALDKAKEEYEDDVISRTNEIQLWIENNGSNTVKRPRGSGFLDFVMHSMNNPQTQTVGSQNLFVTDQMKIDSHLHDEVCKAWYALTFKEKKKWNKSWEICPDPLISIMNPASHFGVVPEKLDDIIEKFIRDNPNLVIDPATCIGETSDDGPMLQSYIALEENPELSKSILHHWNKLNSTNKSKLTKHEFYNLCYNLYMKMLAQPGEAVGLLAAQSIGEPSTQMTLNTFHFAGRGEMNVTLGIPRLREILMTASAKIGTPSMDLPLLTDLTDESGNKLNKEEAEEQAKKVRLAINAVRLSDVLEYVDITEQVVESSFKNVGAESRSTKGRSSSGSKKHRGESNDKSIRYDLHFVLLPSKYYKHEFKTNSSKVMKFIEDVFISQLIESMIKRQKRLQQADDMFDLSTKRNNQKKTTTEEEESGKNTPESEVEEDNLDDFNAKAKKQASEKIKEDQSSSEEEDEEDGDNTELRVKNRRNQDLDYEEPEEDDLEVGDVEDKTALEEEENKEELEDEPSSLIKMKEQEGKDDDCDGDDDVNVQRNGDDDDGDRDADNVEEDIKPTGQNLELASFDYDASNTLPPQDENDEVEVQEPSRKKKKVEASIVHIERIDRVKSKPFIVDYSFDLRHERWCKVSICLKLTTTRLDMGALVEAEAKRTYVHRIGNIDRAFIAKDMNAKSRGGICDLMIKTEGVSLLSLVRFGHILDLNAIYSNDIHAIANTYGIEAASQAIRKEMANVFAVYGIEVDPRHLSLIADYMTYNGSIRGMNRMSMEASSSPFQQMSFESTVRYLKSAAILGLHDCIRSPSAALVFGQPTRGGTGLFSTLADNIKADQVPRQQAKIEQDEARAQQQTQPQFDAQVEEEMW